MIEIPLPGAVVAPLTSADVAEIVVLQRCCWVQEAIANETLSIPALHETQSDVSEWVESWSVVGVRLGERLVAAVRARLDGTDWEAGRLMVAPDLAGLGIGSSLLRLIEELAPVTADRFTLFTGSRSVRNIRTYQRAGYALVDIASDAPGHIAGVAFLAKTVECPQ